MKANELRISSKELRIGNLLQNSYGKIFECGESTFRGVRLNYLDLLPIPLTEEWLLKFGFKSNINKDSGCGYSIFNKFNLWIDNSKIIYWKVKGGIELEHVHQLQNLYFALINKELSYAED